jgi:hypothetical protein
LLVGSPQATGSFKERGARNALLRLSPEAKLRGVVAASAGNHALALAYHGAKLNIPVTVVMPSVRARTAACCALLPTVAQKRALQGEVSKCLPQGKAARRMMRKDARFTAGVARLAALTALVLDFGPCVPCYHPHLPRAAAAPELKLVRARSQTAPMTKVDRSRKYGAQVVLHGKHIAEAREHAVKNYPEMQ